jgi:hypothetical protein
MPYNAETGHSRPLIAGLYFTNNFYCMMATLATTHKIGPKKEKANF